MTLPSVFTRADQLMDTPEQPVSCEVAFSGRVIKKGRLTGRDRAGRLLFETLRRDGTFAAPCWVASYNLVRSRP